MHLFEVVLICMFDYISAVLRISEFTSAVQFLICVSGHAVIHHPKQPVIFLDFLSLTCRSETGKGRKLFICLEGSMCSRSLLLF